MLSPVRDVAGYISSTVNAKSQLKSTQAENNKLKLELAQSQYAVNQYKQADQLIPLDTNYGLKQYGLKQANVIGQDPIYWYKMPPDATPENGSKEFIDALVSNPGPRLGQNESSEYENATMRLTPKDFLVLYTDGVTEPANPDDEECGDARLIDVLIEHRAASAEHLQKQILVSAGEFCANRWHDDATLLILAAS